MWKAAAESGEPIALLNLGDDCAARGDNGKALLWYRRARQNAASVPDIEYTPRVCLRLAQYETRYTSRKKALAQAAEQAGLTFAAGARAGRRPLVTGGRAAALCADPRATHGSGSI